MYSHLFCVNMVKTPKLSISPTKIIVNCRPDEVTKKRIKLSNNDANVSAIFQFDSKSLQSPLQLDEFCGVVEPHTTKYVTIIFKPMEKKIYVHHLPCLILNQVPIFIDFYGYCGTPFDKNHQDSLEASILMDLSNFDRYFIDSKVRRGDRIPPISVSQSYFTFEEHGIMGPRSQIISVTNHCQFEVSFEWNLDFNEVFSINPGVLRIETRKTSHFELSFNPKKENEWYKSDIQAYVSWKIPDDETKLFISKICVIGRYSSKESAWRLRGRVKKKQAEKWVNENSDLLILPSSTPGTSSYATFLIRNDGPRPLAFQFYPSRENEINIDGNPVQFNVKPMSGLIETKKFQIVAVEKLPGILESNSEQRLIIENWKIRFDGDLDCQVAIKFQGYVERPRAIFLDHNHVSFLKLLYPSCTEKKTISLKNLSRLRLRFNILDLPDCLILDRLCGDLNPSDTIQLEWIFRPNRPGDYDFYILCNLVVVEENQGTVEPLEISVHVTGSCRIGLLKGDTSELNFGEIHYEETRKMNLKVYKSLVGLIISFKLILCCPEEEVDVEPEIGIFSEWENSRVFVISITPKELGIFKYVIKCQLGETEDPKDLCWINYSCVLPTIKIVDVEMTNANGPIMSRYILWRLLKINDWNKALSNLRPNDQRNLAISVPMIMFPSILKIVLHNESSLLATLSIEEIQSRIRRKIDKNLIDKNSERVLEPNGRISISIKINPTISSRNECNEKSRIDINVGHNRHVILELKAEASEIFLCEELSDIDEVYLGDINPDYRVYWVYNQSENELSYSLDTKSFEEVNKFHRDNSLTCSNPDGFIQAKSFHPIFFRYFPRRSGVLNTPLPLSFRGNDKDKRTELTLKLKSTLIDTREEKLRRITRLFSTIPRSSDLSSDPIYLNPDFIILPTIVGHGEASRIIMLDNRNDCDVYGYHWKTYKVPGVIDMSVKPKKGIIQPRSLQTFRLIVEVGGKACKMNGSICCELINLTEKRIYQRGKIIFNRENCSEFTITDKGTSIEQTPRTLFTSPAKSIKILTVWCSICDPLNSGKIPMNILSRGYPLSEIQIRRIHGKIHISKEAMDMSRIILENLVWDILNSKLFTDLWRRNSRKLETGRIGLTYSEILQNNGAQAKIKMDKPFASPSSILIQKILENIIFMTIHQEFGLDTIHLAREDQPGKILLNKMSHQIPSSNSKGVISRDYLLSDE